MAEVSSQGQLSIEFHFIWFFKIFFWPRCTILGILVPQPGMEPRPPSLEAQSPNNWTACFQSLRWNLGRGCFVPSKKEWESVVVEWSGLGGHLFPWLEGQIHGFLHMVLILIMFKQSIYMDFWGEIWRQALVGKNFLLGRRLQNGLSKVVSASHNQWDVGNFLLIQVFLQS